MPRDLVELLVDGHHILPALLADLRRAERNIHVSVFLFFRDPIGEEIAGVLEERARAGVDVRVLLNFAKTAMGDPFSTGERRMMRHDPNVDYDPLDVRPLCERMQRAGVVVLDTDLDYDRIIEVADPRLSSLAAQIRGSIDVDALHVDHRKIVTIDGSVAYCGGANFGAQYLYHDAFDPAVDAMAEAELRKHAGLREPWWKWHDSLTRFEGPVVAAIEEEFRARWILDGGEAYEHVSLEAQAPRAGTGALAVESARVLVNAPDNQPNAILELYLGLIAGAERSIFIENPYLYHEGIVAALCAAKVARPALEIVLVLPSRRHNDNVFGQDAQEHAYARFLACGIEVFEYLNHFNHMKIAVFDGRLSVHGSTNLNYRSLQRDKDFELVVLIDDEPLGARILAEVRDVDLTRSRRIDASIVHEKGWSGLTIRRRNPWTLLMLWRRLL